MLKNSNVLLLASAPGPARRGDPGLSEAGSQCAEGWAQALSMNTSQVRRPDLLFVMPDVADDHRARLTMTPLAETLGLELHDQFVRGEHAQLVRHLRREREFDDRGVAICWSAGALLRIAQEFGVEPEHLPPSAGWPAQWSRAHATRLLSVVFDADGRVDVDRTRCFEWLIDASVR